MIDTLQNTIEILPFEALKEDHYLLMEEIFREADTAEGGFFATHYEEIRILLQPGQGTVLLNWKEGKAAGIMLCFGGAGFQPGPRGNQEDPFFDQNATWFQRELMAIGKFGFLKPLVVRPGYRRQGIARELLAEFESYAAAQGIILLAGIIHHQNYPALKLMGANGFQFIDHYYLKQGESEEELWFRVVKILHPGQFYRAINSQTLLKAANTIVPIQLHTASHNLNQLYRPLGAEVTWVSFFQLEPILTRKFHMKKVVSGYYTPLITQDREEYQEVVLNLKKVLGYYRKNEVEGISRISDHFIRSGGFQLILTNAAVGQADFFSFPNPIVIDPFQSTLEDLARIPQLGMGTKLSTREKRDWARVLDKRANKKHPSTEDLVEWEEWKDSLLLSEVDANQALAIAQKRFQKQALSSSEDDFIHHILHHRHIIGAQNREEWDGWLDTHRKLCEADLKKFQGKGTWVHATVPMSFAGGLTGLMFSFVLEDAADQGPDKRRPEHLLNYLTMNISDASAKNMFNIIVKPRNSVIQHYWSKAAISAILARNMSHNLGSHVLAEISNTQVLQALGMEQISRFHSYLHMRIDLLADIATSNPVAAAVQNFRQEVVDEFKDQKILLRHITGSPHQAIEIEYKNCLHSLKGKPDPSRLYEDVQVQIPNGLLGKHAFYIILENLIRNCVKHERNELAGEEPLILKLELRPTHRSERHYKLVIYDNIPRVRKAAYGLDRDQRLVDFLNENFIQAPLFDKRTQEIRTRGWGFLEKKISAAYLRKIPPQDIDHYFKLPLLKAVEVPAGENKYYLGYELYLEKPNNLLLIDGSHRLETSRMSWDAYGIRRLDAQTYQEGSTEFFSHEMALRLGTQVELEKQEEQTWPLRWITASEPAEIEDWEHTIRTQLDQLVLKAWKKWESNFLESRQRQDPKPELVVWMDLPDNAARQLLQETPSRDLIMYDNHGSGQDTAANQVTDIAQLCYYEAYNTTSPTGNFINYQLFPPGKASRNPIAEWKLIEAALTHVAILDERIQFLVNEQIYEPEIPGLDNFDRLAYMNIFLPPPDQINLSRESEAAVITEWVASLGENQAPLDFIIIHLGTIERLVGSGKEEVNGFIRNQIQPHCPQAKVILTSGRGEPHNLGNRTLFLHFSSISQYVTQSLSKLHLCKLLYSARTRLKNDD